MISRLKLVGVWMLAVALLTFGCAPPRAKKDDGGADTKADKAAEAGGSGMSGDGSALADGSKPDDTAKPAEETAQPAEQPAGSGKIVLGSPELTAGIPGSGPLKLAEINAWLADPAQSRDARFRVAVWSGGRGRIDSRRR